MTSRARWARIQDLFQQALELPAPARAVFLEGACGGDAEMQREVESLLAADGRAGDFLEQPAIALVPGGDIDEASGRRIGAYRLVREIGRGGMGAVFLAVRDDDTYRKEVAIKLLKRGMDTDFFVSRFRHERQILARLEHPNIARLLDGGTTDERLPFLVMEYVDGLPLDRYCEQHRLSIAARLKLFVSVCTAVEYAHQHLVIHRDLKPAQVLVTPDGTPKLLDFGIAKLLDSTEGDAQRTAPGVAMMTPEYASPEQIRGEPATTATDVYALGVLLFRLLTGGQPYRLATESHAELAWAICEQMPSKPSEIVTVAQVAPTSSPSLHRLRRRLAGDLDTIVIKALRKEPERRYGSVQQLAADLTRHLSGVPVLARPDTLSYRAGRFVSRHRAAAAAAAVAAVTLAAGLTATWLQARVVRAERAKAEHRFNEVRALAHSFMFDFHDAIVKLPGSTPARELIVKKGLVYLDSLSSDAADDPSLQRELAQGYLRLGHVQGNVFWPNLGDTAGALASYRKALAIEQALLAADHDDTETLHVEANTYRALGEVTWGAGDWPAALEMNRRALDIRKRLAAESSAGPQSRLELADSYVGIGDVERKTGDLAGAIGAYRRGRALFAAVSSDQAPNRPMRRAVIVTDYKIAGALELAGDVGAAIGVFRSALQDAEALAAVDRTDGQAKRDVAMIASGLGEALIDAGDVRGALGQCRRVTAMFEELAASDPLNAQARSDLVVARARLGQALARAGEVDEAITVDREAIAGFKAAVGAAPGDAETRLYSIIPQYGLGELLEQRSRANAAFARYSQALAIWNGLPADQRVNSELTPLVAHLYGKLGARSAREASRATSVSTRVERWHEAHAWYARSLEMWSEVGKNRRLAQSEVGEPARIAGEVGRCKAELRKLGAAP